MVQSRRATTASQIDSFINKTKSSRYTNKYKYWYIDLNLYLRVSKTGRSTWLYRIAIRDESKKYKYYFSYISIGVYPTVSLKTAREEAEILISQTRSKINPLEVRKREKSHLLRLKGYGINGVKLTNHT